MENYVIAISRSYGSDGCAIAEELAKSLNIRFLDKELLSLVSIQSGISEELLSQSDERITKNIWEGKLDRQYNLDFDQMDPRNRASEHNLFRYQAQVLRSLAQQESFVVIGRAADFILQHHRYVFSVNIQAPFEECVEAIMRRKFVDAKTAIKDIRRINKERAVFYRTYTGKDWNDPLNYDLCINSAPFSRKDCGEIIRKAAGLKFKFDL